MYDPKVEIEDIKAEIAKSNGRLIFSGVVLAFCFFGFIVKTCAAMPPSPIPPEPSIECAKVAGAHWVAEEYKLVGGDTKFISGYCDTKKQ